MRNLLLLATLALSCVSLASARPQNNGGFFSGLTNAFNNFFGGSDNRPQQQRPQQFQQQQQPFRQPQQQQQQQFFQPQQQQFQPQPQQFQPQRPASSSQGFQQAPVFRPQPASQPSVVRQPQAAQPAFSQPQQTQNTVSGLSGGTAKCAAPRAPNHFWQGKGYVVTWKFGCRDFENREALEYCQSMGMQPVSLDTPEKMNEFNRLIAQDAQRFFWTGGIVNHSSRTVGWWNSNARTIGFDESPHWSHTGGAGLPQPDNRAAGEQPPSQETCLAILNNFYADGIKWHDVACHHKKPTVCEPAN